MRVPGYLWKKLLAGASLLAFVLFVLPRVVAYLGLGEWAFFVLLFGTAVVGSVVHVRYRIHAWRRMAEGAQLVPVGDPTERWFWWRLPDLETTARGRDVTVATEKRGSSDAGDRWTTVSAGLRQDPAGFELSVRLEAPWGEEDVDVGDRSFDDDVHVETSDPGRARRILDSDVREAILSVDDLWEVRIAGDAVRHGTPTWITDAARVRRHIEMVALLAEAVDEELGSGW